MPNNVRENKIEFGYKNMESILLSMKNEYLKRQEERHDTPDFDEFHDAMLRSLEVEASEADLPNNYKKYLLSDEKTRSEHEKLTKRLREHLITESTMLADRKSGFPHPIPRMRMGVRYYFTLMDDKEFLERFDRVMYEAESEPEQLLRHRAEGMSLEEAEALTKREREVTGLKRGKLYAEMAKQFEQTTSEQLLNLTDEELVDSYAALNYLFHISAAIGDLLEKEKDTGAQTFRFAPEDRAICEHLWSLYNAAKITQNRLKLILNPYYKYLDVNRFREDVSKPGDARDQVLKQQGTQSYINDMASSILSIPKLDIQMEESRDKSIAYLESLNITPDDVTSAVWTDNGKDADVFNNDILRLNDGAQLKLTAKNKCIVIKKDENGYEFEIAKETASIRFMDAVRELGVDPATAVYRDAEGKQLQTEGEAWIDYVAAGKPVTVTSEDTQCEISYDLQNDLQNDLLHYRHSAKNMVSYFEKTAKDIGFQAIGTSYYKDDDTKLDINSDEGKAYIASGKNVTARCGIMEAQIRVKEDGAKITSIHNANPATVRSMLKESLEKNGFDRDKTFYSKPDGTELDLQDANVQEYISTGNPVIATCEAKQFKAVCSDKGWPVFEKTQYHRDNEELKKIVDAKAQTQTDMSSNVNTAFTNTRRNVLDNVLDTLDAADLVRLRISGSRQFKQMKAQLEEYKRICRNLQQEDLNDPERRKSIELSTVKLLRSAQEYLKFKGKGSDKHSERLRINAAKTVNQYAKKQLAFIDCIGKAEKTLGKLGTRESELKQLIDDTKPKKLKQQQAKKNKNPIIMPVKRKNNAGSMTYAKRLFTSQKLISRTNDNLDEMAKWSLAQLDDRTGNVLDRFQSGSNEQKEELLANLIIRHKISIEQSDISRYGLGKGTWELMTEKKECVDELKRRIKETNVFKRYLNEMSKGNLEILKTKQGVELNRLTRDVTSEVKTRIKIDEQKNSKKASEKNAKNTKLNNPVLGDNG